MKNIVTIGGGTGTSVVLSGLKQTPKINLSAIVAVTDSGGSTGRLRDEFGFLPVGDLRQGVVALADGKHQDIVRQLLLYRFKKGKGLKGHNLGNLILTALEDIKKSPGKAIESAAKIFKVKGRVYPVTEKNIQLIVHYKNGEEQVGEHVLDDHQNGGKTIEKISLSSKANIYHKAKREIENADLIIMGPGDLYGSLLPNSLVNGFPQALKKSSAKFIYIVNLMTHYSQTHNMTAANHVEKITEYCGRQPDVIIVNNGEFSKETLQSYAKQKEFPVIDDLKEKKNEVNGEAREGTLGYQKIIRDNFVSKIEVVQDKNDTVPRSLLRHDQEKLAKTLLVLS